MRIGSFCTGYGGLDVAAQAVFGGELAWWSDIEPGPIKVMTHHRPEAPNIGDLKVSDWGSTPSIDILTAGYPCQPFSNAGKRLGTEDPRHLWPYIADAISLLRPRIVVLENVAAHLRRGFDIVLQDLASLGYSVAWSVVRASDVGAPHRRERLYIVATDAQGVGRREGRTESTGFERGPNVAERGAQALADPGSAGLERAESAGRRELSPWGGAFVDWQQYEPAIRRWERRLGIAAPAPSTLGPRGGVKVSPAFAEWLMGVPGRITSVPGLSINEQLKLAGNGVLPQQAEFAIRGLLGRL
jgi:DNA (cytosine-5)-methyltransferase 1